MSDDAVRVFFDQMSALPKGKAKKIDIFLCSNGGNGTVPWRLISLLREFADTIGVLLPYRAYSAATLFALGADEIVMHPFAEMGPIDPTVTNEYNPVDPMTHRVLGISVEDVKAYISFIKSTVGIQHEDELVKTVEILANKVHPLALGNVERFISQSRMIARKILLTHMSDDASRHKIGEIIETMASKLYFHGHPINRKEAKDELGLKIAGNVAPELEDAIWKLYLGFEEEFQNRKPFVPTDRYRIRTTAHSAFVFLCLRFAQKLSLQQLYAKIRIFRRLTLRIVYPAGYWRRRLQSKFEPTMQRGGEGFHTNARCDNSSHPKPPFRYRPTSDIPGDFQI